MDIEEYKQLDDTELTARIRGLPRSVLDEEFQTLGGQYANLCQRLEAVYTGEREERFIAIRPGGLQEIDHAIELAQRERGPELPLLKSFRDLNRVLLPFMDVFEERVLEDIKNMSRSELEAFYATVRTQLNSATSLLDQKPDDYRAQQNAGGKIRLGNILREAIRKELLDRFDTDPDQPV